MKSFFAVALYLLAGITAAAQQVAFIDSLERYQQNYVASHEVVKGTDKKLIKFYRVDKKYRVAARFEKINDTAGFIMKTSGTRKTKYYRYGMLYFRINKTALRLTIYQSEKLMADTAFKNYLFVPFTDLTSGEKSYGGGRYLDFIITDIKNNTLIIDFNKSYNPYCAYMTGFSCPIPPAENNLAFKIEAGEMEFAKKH
ncbi:MAG: DUF1684 domain-containing protein [Ferruginibacter sp.]